MAKMWLHVHPANPKVGDDVASYEVEVPDDVAPVLDGCSWPALTVLRG